MGPERSQQMEMRRKTIPYMGGEPVSMDQRICGGE